MSSTIYEPAVSILSNAVITMLALATDVAKSDPEGTYRDSTAGAFSIANSFSELKQRFDEAHTGSTVEAQNLLRKELYHREVQRGILKQLLGNPHRAAMLKAAYEAFDVALVSKIEADDEKYRADDIRLQGELSELRRGSADWAMENHWYQIHGVGQDVFQCTEKLWAIAGEVRRLRLAHSWGRGETVRVDRPGQTSA